MNAQEFMDAFAEIIQADSEFNLDTPLAEIEEWDSMSMMGIIAYFDVNHGKTVTFDDLASLKTVHDIARLVPGFAE